MMSFKSLLASLFQQQTDVICRVCLVNLSKTSDQDLKNEKKFMKTKKLD